IAAQWSMMAIPLVGFPAVAVPTSVSDGLPLGVQLLAQRFREDLLLDAAEVIEGRAGRFTPSIRTIDNCGRALGEHVASRLALAEFRNHFAGHQLDVLVPPCGRKPRRNRP